MMALLLGQFANLVHESQGGLKIGKLVGADDVVFFDDIPLCGLRQLPMNLRELIALQRRNSAVAGDASFVGKS
jgi:hypothetical protein